MNPGSTAIGPAAVWAVLRRPTLWPTAIKAVISIAPNRWWARGNRLPVPAQAWMAFRLETAYGGDGTGPMGPDELVTWLKWKRDLPR